MSTQRILQNPTGWTVRIAPNPNHTWRNTWLFGRETFSMLSLTLLFLYMGNYPERQMNGATQKTHPTTHLLFLLPDPSLPAPFSTVAGHFMLEPAPFKTGWPPPHLHHGVLSPFHGTSPRTAEEPPAHRPLSTMIPSPRVCVDPPAFIKGEEACANHDAPEPRRQIRCLQSHCHGPLCPLLTLEATNQCIYLSILTKQIIRLDDKNMNRSIMQFATKPSLMKHKLPRFLE